MTRSAMMAVGSLVSCAVDSAGMTCSRSAMLLASLELLVRISETWRSCSEGSDVSPATMPVPVTAVSVVAVAATAGVVAVTTAMSVGSSCVVGSSTRAAAS